MYDCTQRSSINKNLGLTLKTSCSLNGLKIHGRRNRNKTYYIGTPLKYIAVTAMNRKRVIY